MADSDLIILCNYWQLHLSKLHGVTPLTCDMCRQQIAVSAPGIRLKNNGAKLICPKCCLDNAPDENDHVVSNEDMRELARSFGVPDEYMDEVERMGIKAVAQYLHDNYVKNNLN